MSIRSVALRLIGLLALAYVLSIVDLTAVGDQVRRIGGPAIAAATAGFLVLLAARCLRWHLLVRRLAPKTTFAGNVVMCNGSIWLGLATPGRLGEFRRAIGLAQSGGIGLAEASGLVLLDLLIDLSGYGAAALAGLAAWVLRDHAPFDKVAWVACLAAAIICVVRLPALSHPLRSLARGMDRVRLLAVLPATAAALDTRSSLGVAVTTAVSVLAYAAMISVLGASMHLGLGAIETLTMVGLVALSGAIPITYFGFGTREVALIWYFSELGLSKENAVAVSVAFIVAQLLGICVSLACAAAARLARWGMLPAAPERAEQRDSLKP